MKHIALGLLLLIAAGCGKPEPPPSPPSPAPVPPSPAPPPSPPPPPPPASTSKSKSKLPDELRKKLEEQLANLPDEPMYAALRKRLQEQLGVTPEPPRPLVPRPPEPPRPQVYLTVNGTDVPEIPAGFPIVIELSVHAPSSGPMRLEAPSGNWGDLVRVEFPDGWSPKAAAQGSGPLSMDGASFGRLVWTLSPEETDAHPRGEAELRATLKCDRGEFRAVARVKLTAPKKLTPDQELERTFALVRWRTATGDAAGALADVDAALKTSPLQPALHELRADTLLSLGRKAEAAAALDAAIAVALKQKRPTGRLVARRESLGETK
jgi:hypothetical protein